MKKKPRDARLIGCCEIRRCLIKRPEECERKRRLGRQQQQKKTNGKKKIFKRKKAAKFFFQSAIKRKTP